MNVQRTSFQKSKIQCCGDLGLFLSSFVLKRRKYFALIHTSFKLSMVKASIFFFFFFFFFKFKSIADMKRWSTYQLTDHGVPQYCTQK